MNCYLCNLPISSDSLSDIDHIIPDMLFNKHFPNRPKLEVHRKCNILKSKEDEWFVRNLQMRTSFNPEAEKEFTHMINKAIGEKRDAYIIGKKPRNLVLAKGILDKIIWGLELKHNGQSYIQIRIPERDVIRFNKYIATIARGLFVFNVPSAKPTTNPEIIQRQFADLELKNKGEVFINSINSLVTMSNNSRFGQRWGDKIMYIGSRVKESANKGYIYIQFYSQFGALVIFN